MLKWRVSPGLSLILLCFWLAPLWGGDHVGEPELPVLHRMSAPDDYRLPDWVKPEPGTGMPLQFETVVYASWSIVEPRRGVYDFSVMDRALEASDRTGRPVVVRFENLVWSGEVWHRPGTIIKATAPAWLVEEMGVKPVWFGGRMKFWVIPAWRPEVHEAYMAMVREFIRRYAADPRVVGLHVHAIGTWGEEFGLKADPEYFTTLPAAGADAAVLGVWIERRIRETAAALGPYAGKLAWVGSSRASLGDQYAPLASRMMDVALEVGGGFRSGIIERFFQHYGDALWGHVIDKDGHLTIDEANPIIADHARYWGDENEEYGEYWTGKFPLATQGHRLRASTFMSLACRMRQVWVNQAAIDLDPALIRYSELSLGKTAENAGDAFALLCEAQLAADQTEPAMTARNIERWLVQRDVAGAVSVPALPLEPGYNFGRRDPVHPVVFTGRRTDRARGQHALAFGVDPRFRGGEATEFSVETMPLEPVRWRVELRRSDGAVAVSAWIVQAGGAEGPENVTFSVPAGLWPTDRAADGIDVRLVTAPDSRGNLTVRLVRLLRRDAPHFARP